jgi:DNA polymerase-3 subunit epsilon
MIHHLPPEPLVFIDLETTGANFANDRIIEIGLVEVDANGAREWSTLVNPETSVSGFITGLTGIDTQMVAAAPKFEEIASLVAEKLHGRLFIAHNARFDYGFIKREFKRLGIDFRVPTLCTVKLSRKLFPMHHRHNLDTLVERHGVIVGDRHRALADARVLWDLWQRWHQALPADTIRQAVDAIVGRPELPPQIDSAVLDDLPEAPGAYAMYAEDGAVLRVKRCTNIRQQVFAHFTPENRDTALVRNTWRIDWREAAGELGARLQEIALSNVLRKPVDELCAWQLLKHAEGDFRPKLVHARDLDFGATDDLFGLYMNRREALHALRKMAEAHHLCHSQLGLGEAGKDGACVAYKQKSCRGACIGKEAVSLHSARLMAALAKFKLKKWPYKGAIAMVERDEFGMREDFHLIDRWRYLATVQNEPALHECLEKNAENEGFEPDIYRILTRFVQAGKVRIIPLPASY